MSLNLCTERALRLPRRPSSAWVLPVASHAVRCLCPCNALPFLGAAGFACLAGWALELRLSLPGPRPRRLRRDGSRVPVATVVARCRVSRALRARRIRRLPCACCASLSAGRLLRVVAARPLCTLLSAFCVAVVVSAVRVTDAFRLPRCCRGVCMSTHCARCQRRRRFVRAA